MVAYLDSSVILRVALGEPGRLREWEQIEEAVTSALAEVECLRTLDRMRVQGTLPPNEIADRRETVFRLLEGMQIVELTRPVLARASQSFPTPLGSLDALHLSTALLYKERGGPAFHIATHDLQLATAARASGLIVLGA